MSVKGRQMSGLCWRGAARKSARARTVDDVLIVLEPVVGIGLTIGRRICLPELCVCTDAFGVAGFVLGGHDVVVAKVGQEGEKAGI